MTWTEALKTTRYRWTILFCFCTLLLIVFYMPIFYHEILGPKKGWTLSDPVLGYFHPTNWSLPVFIILYVAVIQTVLSCWFKPELVVLGLTTYCVVNIFRILTMYTVTLEPPVDMILLSDPISSIAYPDKGFAKDLFFSGHISTMMVLVLIERNRIALVLKVLGTVAMSVFLAWQHVHYAIDIVAAPLITYGIYLLVKGRLVVPGKAIPAN
jgi:hypothetical protein